MQTATSPLLAISQYSSEMQTILRSLEHLSGCGWMPMITGSRFFGTAHDESDYDFVAQFNNATKIYLTKYGFIPLPLPCKGMNLQETYRLPRLKMDVQLFLYPHLRIQSMIWMRNLDLKNDLQNKLLARKIFILASTWEVRFGERESSKSNPA